MGKKLEGKGKGDPSMVSGASLAPDTKVSEKVLSIPIGRIRRFSTQPREYFANISELAACLKEIGQLQPGIVIEINGDPDYDYELVDGERRFRACQVAGIPHFLATLKKVKNPGEQFAISVASNFNRQNHSPLETAWALKRLKESDYTSEQMATICGRSLAWVTQHLSLLRLDERVQKMMSSEAPDEPRLSFSVALMLTSLSPDKQVEAAQDILAKDLDLRATKHFIKQLVAVDPSIHIGRKRPPSERFDLFRSAIERVLRETEHWVSYPEDYVPSLIRSRPETERSCLREAINTTIGNLQWLKIAIESSRVTADKALRVAKV